MEAVKQTSSMNNQPFLSFKKRIMDNPEPFPLKKFRKISWDKMEKSSWSELDREDWRYTRYDSFFPSTFIYSGSNKTTICGLTKKDIKFGVRVIKYPDQTNGILRFIQEDDQINYFNDKWIFLNFSLFNDGVFIEIPKNHKVEGLIYVQHHSPGEGLGFPLTYINLNEGSELSIIEEFKGEENSTKDIISNTIINLEDNSKLNHVFIQNLSKKSKGLHYQNAFLERDSIFNTHSVQIGSKISRFIQNVELRGPGGYLKNYGLLYGCNGQHIDIQTNQVHKAPYTGGELLYRHVLTDRAKSIFKGKIVIEKGKTFCNSSQKNENLLLSPKAEAISLPKLEILNNEVKCSHGGTISSIDEEELFYLTSRGIGMDDARKMIIEGFFEEIIKKTATQDIADIISKKIKEAL